LLFQKKKNLSSTLEKAQKNFDAHKSSCRAKFPIIDENEIFTLKNKIDIISNVFKKCEFDKARLKATFSKRQTQRKHHTHTPPQSQAQHDPHAHHAHTNAQSYHAHTHHAFLYAMCMYAPIVAVKVIWLSFVMID